MPAVQVPRGHGQHRQSLFDQVVHFLVILIVSAALTFMIGSLVLGSR